MDIQQQAVIEYLLKGYSYGALAKKYGGRSTMHYQLSSALDYLTSGKGLLEVECI